MEIWSVNICGLVAAQLQSHRGEPDGNLGREWMWVVANQLRSHRDEPDGNPVSAMPSGFTPMDRRFGNYSREHTASCQTGAPSA